MNPLAILLAEIRYRKINFALSLLAVVIAVTLLVAGPILVDGHGRKTDAEMANLEDDTRKTMRDLGFNLTILHGATDMSQFWATGLPTHDMDQEYVDRLARDPSLTMVTHIVGTLRAKLDWDGRTVPLAGYMPEATQSHRRKRAPMGYRVEPGTVFLGYHLAHGKKEGDTVQVQGRPFRVAKTLPELGSEVDSTMVMHLSDAQELCAKPGKVNEILALDCRCAEADLPKIRKQVADILPECVVIRDDAIATARARQRASVAEKHQRIQRVMVALADVVTPLVVLAAAVWVGLLAMANVRERMTEIGVLRALGKGSGMIASLFLGKAVLLGLLGGAVGLLLGAGTAWLLGVRVLELSADQFHLPPSVLLSALLGAPLLSALASYLPALSALMQDPAVVLRDP